MQLLRLQEHLQKIGIHMKHIASFIFTSFIASMNLFAQDISLLDGTILHNISDKTSVPENVFDGDINTPRLPSYKIRKTLTDDSVRFLTFADFGDQDPDHYGLSGSATQVERIFPPEKTTHKQVLEGDADTLAQSLFGLLQDQKRI